MYSIADFGAMIEDKVRMEAYVHALRNSIKHGSVVVDIGTGTGIAALLACKFGAAHVYAIEPNPAIQVAREIAKANGLSEKITLIQKLSTEVSLPERADVIVSDMRGVLPLQGNHIPSIIDARNRFLKPGGCQIPQKDILMIAGLSANNLYCKISIPWSENSYDLDMSAGLNYVTNTWGKGRARPEQLLLASQPLATLDYTSIEEPNISQHSQWIVKNTGVLHGYQMWFDAVLTEGVTFSTGPHTPELIYGTQFFPLSKPVELQGNDVVKVRVEAKLIEDEYTWRWDTTVKRAGDMIVNFKQNSLACVPLSLDQLRKSSNKYVPSLNEKGEMTMFVLEMMSNKIVLGEIASQLVKRYPERFSKWEIALSFAGELCQKYT